MVNFIFVTFGLALSTRQSIIHLQDLKQIYFVINFGYEDLRETAP